MLSLVWFLVIGGLAGWLAGVIFKGRGFGVMANIGIGIVGSLIGGVLFHMLQIAPSGKIGELVTATVGAILLLFVASKFRKG